MRHNFFLQDWNRKLGSERFRVLTLVKNLGKGGAVRRGVLVARGRKILFADADGATTFSELDKLVKALPGEELRSELFRSFLISHEVVRLLFIPSNLIIFRFKSYHSFAVLACYKPVLGSINIFKPMSPFLLVRH